MRMGVRRVYVAVKWARGRTGDFEDLEIAWRVSALTRDDLPTFERPALHGAWAYRLISTDGQTPTKSHPLVKSAHTDDSIRDAFANPASKRHASERASGAESTGNCDTSDAEHISSGGR